jgi:phosphonate metabolism protein PhnN/1,5-bisphosphokinase (PRPP-forming)
LILVVGPSGAGKDALMSGAALSLVPGGRFHFARRVVTRPAQAGAEDHDSLPLDEFRRRQAQGGYLLSWDAHGLAYGVPAELDALRVQGRAVVVNVSRTVVDEARARLAPVGVVVVTAPTAVLAARLAGRGRESMDDIERRLERAKASLPSGPDVVVVNNDGDLKAGIDLFTDALRRLHSV